MLKEIHLKMKDKFPESDNSIVLVVDAICFIQHHLFPEDEPISQYQERFPRKLKRTTLTSCNIWWILTGNHWTKASPYRCSNHSCYLVTMMVPPLPERTQSLKVPSYGATLLHATVACNKVAPCGGTFTSCVLPANAFETVPCAVLCCLQMRRENMKCGQRNTCSYSCGNQWLCRE